jgi:hypothetical protein
MIRLFSEELNLVNTMYYSSKECRSLREDWHLKITRSDVRRSAHKSLLLKYITGFQTEIFATKVKFDFNLLLILGSTAVGLVAFANLHKTVDFTPNFLVNSIYQGMASQSKIFMKETR